METFASSTGTRMIQRPVARSVSTSVAASASSAPVKNATPIASRSTTSTSGHTRKDTSGIRAMASNTSSSATGGNRCAHHAGAAPGRTRCSTRGKTVCSKAKTKHAPSAHNSRVSLT